jgi:pullulanase/glycogen debranching enzyme
VDWDLQEKGKHLLRFVQKLTALRHKFPILRRGRFYTGSYNEVLGVKDVTWINANGQKMRDEHWADSAMRCFGMLLDGPAQRTGIQKYGDDATLLLAINGHSDLVQVTLPESFDSDTWSLFIDTKPGGERRLTYAQSRRKLRCDRQLSASTCIELPECSDGTLLSDCIIPGALDFRAANTNLMAANGRRSRVGSQIVLLVSNHGYVSRRQIR